MRESEKQLQRLITSTVQILHVIRMNYLPKMPASFSLKKDNPDFQRSDVRQNLALILLESGENKNTFVTYVC